MKSLDYSKTEVPSDYKCKKCGATNCKLWRETSFCAPDLFCVDCACTDQNKTNNVNEEGLRVDIDKFTTDQIGWHVPAVPTKDNFGYWSYTSVPDEGVQWWTRLPLRPNSAAPAAAS